MTEQYIEVSPSDDEGKTSETSLAPLEQELYRENQDIIERNVIRFLLITLGTGVAVYAIARLLRRFYQRITRKKQVSMDANTLFAAVSALIDAITLWRSARDRRQAANTLEREFERVEKRSNLEAVAIQDLVPSELLEVMSARVLDCFEKYHRILKNDKEFFPEDIDGATNTVILCVCRELHRIYKLNQHIPPGKLSDWWNGYKCFSKLT